MKTGNFRLSQLRDLSIRSVVKINGQYDSINSDSDIDGEDAYKLTVQESCPLSKDKNVVRGFDDFEDKAYDSSHSSSEDDHDHDEDDDDESVVLNSLVHYDDNSNPPQHSLLQHSTYKASSTSINTGQVPQISAGICCISSERHSESKTKGPPLQPLINNIYPKTLPIYKQRSLICDDLKEKGPILLDIPGRPNELVLDAFYTQSIPKLYPIVGLRKELPAIALPPPVPLDLPKLPGKSVKSHHKDLGHDLIAGPVAVSNTDNHKSLVGSGHTRQQHFHQNLDFYDPTSIISIAAVYLQAGDYGTVTKVLEILDKHLVLPEDIDMAREFGQGLAYYKSQRYKTAKPFFDALCKKSVHYSSPSNQALASIYLGEIETLWAKYENAVKHFTLAITNYGPDNVAKKLQQTILTKSAVLVKKGLCHRSLSQIKEAIKAFKLAKEVAKSVQQQARGSNLKAAKEDELGAVSALGNIFQSIGDYEQSYEYQKKSLKLADELGDHVSIGWAHGNLGNAMLGLDQKDKALDHLIIAFHLSARYECNPLAVGRAVSNLGNVYQAMDSLPKAKEYFEISLGHAIYGNDLHGQARACGNIGNVYMLLKEPVKAVHYYTETLHLSTDKSTRVTGYHNRGCARLNVAENIIQGKKPKELVPATTAQSEYGRLTIKLTDNIISSNCVQETKPNKELSAQSISEQKKFITSSEPLPIIISGKSYDGIVNEEIIRLIEALPFLETAKSDLLEAIESHEQSIQNVKGSHEALSLSLSLFDSNSRSFYKMQETLVELGKLRQQLSQLGVMHMDKATEAQEFKAALVYGEQARARTLGELVFQKKRFIYSDLFSVHTPLELQDIYKAVTSEKVPVIFLSYCVTKLLMWILVQVKDEIVMKCQTIEFKEEDLENSSFELYIRYNLLQYLSKDEIYIFRRGIHEQESPFTVLHDVIAVKIIEGLRSVGFSEATELIVIPDSVTQLLPFFPLMNKYNWQFFGDRYRIRIVPSFLSLLVMSMDKNPVVNIPGDKNDFLIVGNPTIPPFMHDSIQWNLGRLPYAEKEAISVASILGTVPVLREQATKHGILYRLRSAKVIHLATHGSASAGFLAFTSSFPVSKTGLAEPEHILLFPKEIETLNISPALVVLSSCDSARGQVKSEGVIGMARAFLSAGAQSVLVSLWKVPDESASIFMQFFYQFLVNGLLSLHALQRSTQCLRCFAKYSQYVHWSGFQIIGKEVRFSKTSQAQFPIHRLLGEASIFPRPYVKDIEESLLDIQKKIYTDVQVLVGTPGNEPEECARDFIKNCYYYYPSGVYWYDASNELLLETGVKACHETPLTEGIYKEQNELDHLPVISNPSLLTARDSKHISRKQKKLIVLHNYVTLQTCTCIMRELKDASTDIIIVSNEVFCKEALAKDFDKHFTRGCNIIEVANLPPISITQRLVYKLLEKHSFVARDADHIVFTLLSEYSRGSTTVVHLLSSLMQNGDDNSRTGFELSKQFLKLHIAHLKLLNNYNTLREDNSRTKMQNFEKNSMTEKAYLFTPQNLEQSSKENAQLAYKSTSSINESISMLEIEIPSLLTSKNILQMQIENVPYTPVKASSAISSTTQPTIRAEEGQNVITAPIHPLHLYINDLLSNIFSLPANQLLNILVMTGPVPLPLFYVEELNNIVTNAIISNEKKMMQELQEFIPESPMNQLAKGGVIRNSCYPLVYHKDLNPENLISNIQQVYIPKLICDAVKYQMDDTDKVLLTICAQHALENLLNNNEVDLIQLHYLLILCNQLHNTCIREFRDHEFSEKLLITSQKLMLTVSQRYKFS